MTNDDIPDRIDKETVLAAPLARVWRAISDAEQFGQWFGVRFDGPFTAGTRLTGVLTPTTVDPAVAKQQEPYAGKTFTITVEEVVEPRRLSFRWHPGVDAAPGDPTTLVEFELSPVEGGTRLRISESGFHGIPLERRAEAFTGNAEGWAHQLRLVAGFLGLDAA